MNLKHPRMQILLKEAVIGNYMTNKIKRIIGRNLINIPGWKTNRKIVVIESDDWGSIRMPSNKVLENLIDQGVKFNMSYGFDQFDTLASEEDLSALFDILSKYQDKNGNHPIITANTIVANPNFDMIKATGYSEYHYELFIDTLKYYRGCEKSFELWIEGINSKVFYPQFHGREHVNVQMWLNALRQNYFGVRASFDKGVFSSTVIEDNRTKFLHALNISSKEEQPFIIQSIKEGLRIFESIFGYKSKSFIAPSYIWDSYIEECLKEQEVQYIQTGPVQIHSQYERLVSGRKSRRHFCGQRNLYDQRYIVRNCIFEPCQNKNLDSIKSCFTEIENAFFWHKPAIISSHRLNYIGSLNPQNRNTNLKLLSSLLQKIILAYPDVEFLTSDSLGDAIKYCK